METPASRDENIGNGVDILRPGNSNVDFHCYPIRSLLFPYCLHLASNGCKIHLLGFYQ